MKSQNSDSLLLSRRKFLKGLGAATVAASIPQLYREGSVLPIQTDPMDYGMVIDADGMSASDLYDAVKIILRHKDGTRTVLDRPNITFL